MDFTADAAPWWYVALLAGAFTILGGLISVIGSWLNDLSKSQREHRADRQREIVGVATQYLLASGALRDFVADGLRLPEKQWERRLGGDGAGLVNGFIVATFNARMVFPKKLWTQGELVYRSTTDLLLPNPPSVRQGFLRDLDSAHTLLIKASERDWANRTFMATS